MKEARYFYVPDAATAGVLPADEAQHAARVLRMSEGDELFLIDGAGTFFRATLTMVSSHRCAYRIEEALPQRREWPRHIHLAIAPTKMLERMEWLVEKATEIGFDEFTPLECRWSERRVLKTERMERIVVAAMKQSRKAWKPAVQEMTALTEFLTAPREGLKFIAHCHQTPRQDLVATLREAAPDAPITVLVGPEGDFSEEEVALAEANGYQSVSLGTSRLRTETAGLYAVMAARMS